MTEASPSVADTAAILKRHFGYETFRPNQESVVDAVIAGRDVLAVMPTGAGKSVCYQVPAMALPGITVVVSPLISLMADQVRALAQADIPAAFINSTLSGAQQTEVLHRAADGAYKLLYVAPERLMLTGFLNFCRACPPSAVAIDEAHCISQWGQDFRPSYTRINDFLDELPTRPPVCALTATATPAVRDDILSVLNLRDPFIVTAGFDRPNLHFAVERPANKKKATLEVCRSHGGRSGIVYCTSRRAVEDVCEYLCGQGVTATRYHAGLDAAERNRNQHDFLFDRAAVMVATNAFGMGIDKSDVGFVVHYNMPLDLESYYQEAGRAGRDGQPADCVLLYAPKDVRTAEYLISIGIDENAHIDGPTRAALVKRARDRLAQMTFYSTGQDCLRATILRYFGETPPANCGNCGNCETEFEERDVTVDAQKVLSCVYRLDARDRHVGRSTIVDILRGSKAEKMTLSGFDTLSTFGIMASSSTQQVRFLLDRLVDRGFLRNEGTTYPVIFATPEAARFLKSRDTLTLKVPKVRPKTRKADRSRGNDALSTGDAALYERLRELRSRLAAQADVPAYVVFSNATLTDMAQRKPTTRDEFLRVSGVGQVKADRYGDVFLAEIAAVSAGPER